MRNNKKNNKNKKRNIDFKYNLSLYWDFLKEYKLIAFGLLLLILLMQVISLADKLLLKIIIDKGAEFTANTLSSNEFIQILFVVLGAFIVLSFVTMVFDFLKLHYTFRLNAGMVVDLRRKFFNHILHLDYNFHTTHKTGALISRLGRGGGAIERLTDFLIFQAIPFLLQVVVALISVIYFSWVSAIVIIITMLLFILYSFVILRFQGKANLITNNKEDIEKAHVGDFFTNIDSIKYFGKERLVKNKFKNLSEDTKCAVLRSDDYFKWMSSVQVLIIAIGTAFLLYFPVKEFLAGELTLGSISFIYGIFGTIIYYLYSFVYSVKGFYKSMADFEVLFQYNKFQNAIKDKPNAKNLKIRYGDLDFRNMTFKYLGKKKIFNDYNLKIPHNKKVAFVGHSGCGKTTLVKLLYRLYDLDSGEILIDGKNINEFKQVSLRSELSIVPQECVLFDDTIYNNVAFSNPLATKQQVMRAIKFAQLDNFIRELPQKEKTIVGERGVKLSGGEKQRVSIARALLANKKILVLDEATSALDSETETEIQKDLEKLMKGRTSIIIAHRLSTIMKADIIVVMGRGKILQIGSHMELIKQDGEYKKLWNLQKGGYIK